MNASLIRKIKIFIELLLVTIVSYFLADACYVLFFVEQAAVPKHALRFVSKSGIISEQIDRNSYDLIEQRNLLKVRNILPSSAPSATRNEAPVESVAISKRGIHLLGTIYADTPSQRRAIFLFKNEQSLKRNGDTVGGWSVVDIKRCEVILQRDGIKERLVIDAKGDVTEHSKKNDERLLARRFVKNELKNLDELAQSIQLEPKQIAGSEGLQIRFLRSRSFFHNIGLRKGDVLVQVNGKAVTSFSNVASLLPVLDSELVSVNVIRNGKHLTLTYRLVN